MIIDLFHNVLQESITSASRKIFILFNFRNIIFFSTFFSKYTHKNVKYVCTKTRTKKKKDRKNIIHIRIVLNPKIKIQVCYSWKVSCAA